MWKMVRGQADGRLWWELGGKGWGWGGGVRDRACKLMDGCLAVATSVLVNANYLFLLGSLITSLSAFVLFLLPCLSLSPLLSSSIYSRLWVIVVPSLKESENECEGA